MRLWASAFVSVALGCATQDTSGQRLLEDSSTTGVEEASAAQSTGHDGGSPPDEQPQEASLGRDSGQDPAAFTDASQSVNAAGTRRDASIEVEPSTPPDASADHPSQSKGSPGVDAATGNNRKDPLPEASAAGAAPHDATAHDATSCTQTRVEIARKPVAITFLISNAGGMFSSQFPNGSGSGPFGQYLDRWTAVGSALNELPDDGFDYQFISFTGFSPANGGECPVMRSLELPLPPSSEAVYDGKMESPLADALQAAYAKQTSIGQRYLVLLTEGNAEGCPVELMDKGNWCGHDPAIASVQRAFADGVQTFVVGLLAPEDSSDARAARDYLLDGLAHAGVGEPVKPPSDNFHCIQQEAEVLRSVIRDDLENWREFADANYGPPGVLYEETLYLRPPDDDLYNFADGLTDLILGLGACRFTLSSAVGDDELTVLVDGAGIGSTSWSIDDGALVLSESPCAAVRQGASIEVVTGNACGN